jgi:predicted transcriptional regulator
LVSKLMLTLELLSDEKWHGTDELMLRLELSEQKFQEITAFLNTYGFVKVDEKNRKVKINKDFKKLLVKTVT